MKMYRLIWSLALIAVMIMMTAPVNSQQDDNVVDFDDATNLDVLTLIQAHDTTIAQMAFSPDGRSFVTVGFDNLLCVWNVSQLGQIPGKLRVCFDGYSAGVSQFAWSSDGDFLAVSRDVSIEVFDITDVITEEDAADYEAVHSLLVGEAFPLTIEFHADDTQIITQDIDGNTHLYNLQDESLVFSRESQVSHLLGADDALLIFNDDSLAYMDTVSGLMKFRKQMNVRNVVVSDNEDWLAFWNWDANSVQVWSAEQLQVPFADPNFVLETPIDGATFSPDGSVLVTWHAETLTFWDLDTGTELTTLDGHRGGISYVGFKPDMTRAITVSSRGTGRLWTLDDEGLPSFRVWIQGDADRIEVSPDGESFITFRESFGSRFFSYQTGQLRGNGELLSTQAIFNPSWTIMAQASGGLVTWIGLETNDRTFDWMPIGVANGLINIRPTPSQDLPRIVALTRNTKVFALGISDDGDWLFVQLPDGTQGWTLLSGVTLTDNANLNGLDEVDADILQ